MTDDPYLYDDDPYDTHKDSCACGHRRSAHAVPDGACTREVERTDYDSLPTPVYEREDIDPFAWPLNWPEADKMPKRIEPCGCKGFSHPEPAEPDRW